MQFTSEQLHLGSQPSSLNNSLNLADCSSLLVQTEVLKTSGRLTSWKTGVYTSSACMGSGFVLPRFLKWRADSAVCATDGCSPAVGPVGNWAGILSIVAASTFSESLRVSDCAAVAES
jgi:hypothetical protein